MITSTPVPPVARHGWLGARVSTVVLLALAVLAPHRSLIHATGPNSWSSAGTMIVARSDQTATLLRDGRVLVAGGRALVAALQAGHSIITPVITASAELYNPRTQAWAQTGSMGTPRVTHTATLLPDGTILVAGGASDSVPYLSSAEIYNPATGRWRATGRMHLGRGVHTATLLRDGTVLVVGGGDTAEVYHPHTGTWTITGRMHLGRVGHTATLLRDGTVLVAGTTGGPEEGRTAEVYQPRTGRWTRIGDMTTARTDHTATLLPDGHVLVVGGNGLAVDVATSAEVYNPRTGTWAATGHTRMKRYDSTATPLHTGDVLVAGGGSLDGARTGEVYNWRTGHWSATGAMMQARAAHTATLLPDGRVLVAGGCVAPGLCRAAELYTPGPSPTLSLSPSTLDFSAAPQPLGATSPPQTVIITNTGSVPLTIRRVGVTGPARQDFSATTTCAGAIAPAHRCAVRVRFTPTVAGARRATVVIADNAPDAPHTVLAQGVGLAPGHAIGWRQTGSLLAPTTREQALLLPNGEVLVAGGYVSAANTDMATSSAEVYDPATGAWRVAGPMGAPRIDHTMILLPGGLALVAGGGANDDTPLSSAEVYNPGTGVWTSAGSMQTPRSAPVAALLPSGRVLVAGGAAPFDVPGGADRTSGNCDPHSMVCATASAEIYDPQAGTWTPTGRMLASGATSVTTLSTGKVLATFADGSAELYDPSAGGWSSTGRMVTRRLNGATATRLANGRVLVTGGSDDSLSVVASAEVYEPATGQWTATGAMTVARTRHTATLLPTGQVLVVGGLTAPVNEPGARRIATASAEVYDPGTGRWTTTASLATARADHTATLLRDGTILVAGGEDPDNSLIATAEVYSPIKTK